MLTYSSIFFYSGHPIFLRKIMLGIFFILIPLQFNYAACKTVADPALRTLMQAGAVFSTHIQTDFGRVEQGSSCYLEVWPTSTAQVAKWVAIAYRNHIAIRTQGAAHSQQGSALPKSNELLIHTTKLNSVTFDRIGQIRAESGVPMALLVELVAKESGYFVPISNSGGVASSVGGFISAGGLGEFSNRYGGFWEHVDQVTLVIKNGEIIKIKKNDPIFNYLFGSLGQLGIITEAELNLLRDPRKPFLYPLHKHQAIQVDSSDGNTWRQSVRKPQYWFTLFIAPERMNEAQLALQRLRAQYPKAMQYQSLFLFKVAYISKMPPLIYDDEVSFMGIGFWASLVDKDEFLTLKDDFVELVLRKHYREYIQTSPSASPLLYARYFSPQTLQQFKSIKTQLDPDFLFNKESFFSQKINYQQANARIRRQ